MIEPIFYKRRKTRTVFVGGVGVGGNNPIRIQSMTISDTKDTQAVVKEIEDLVNAGCEIVRLTVPTKPDAANLKNIRAALKEKGLKVPIVADIHFTPSVAMDVVEFVEKVRINPGNFVDRKVFKVFEYTDEQYQEELQRIEEKFTPLVEKCKKYGVAMRIGTNHGSLSDRIMNRFGDTPEGMVESALEFLRIAAKNNYHDIILSMKASNTQVMVTAYRLLAKRMDEEGMDYPFHLGVTEAGDGEDGRIKSSVGIGALLEEGIGDTIRVSLTEDSIHEIPVAGILATPYNQKFYINQNHEDLQFPSHLTYLFENRFSPSYERRKTSEHSLPNFRFGGKETVRVWTELNDPVNFEYLIKAQSADNKHEGVEIAYENYTEEFAKHIKAHHFDLAVRSNDDSKLVECDYADKLTFVLHHPKEFSHLQTLIDYCKKEDKHLELFFENYPMHDTLFSQDLKELVAQFTKNNFTNFSFSLISAIPTFDYRLLVNELDRMGVNAPLHLRYRQNDLPLMTDASIQLGSLLLDGIGDSIQIDGEAFFKKRLRLSYGILQACRVRISKTEFIACPSCGRTQFELQDVTAKIKAKTDHLKGVKIAIMGCIVNGPGEMADADFGYVGTGEGRISLYVGKECVTRNIPEANALDELIALIKKHDQWVEPVDTAA